MRIAWTKKGPPPVLMVSGSNYYLRKRLIRHLIQSAYKNQYEVIIATSDGEVITGISMGSTFGTPTLIWVRAADVALETLQEHLDTAPAKMCLLIEVNGAVKTKHHKALEALVPAKQHMTYMTPSKKSDRRTQAVSFIQKESDRLFRKKDTLNKKFAQAIVSAVGDDLGVLAFEIDKYASLARSQGATEIKIEHIKALIRPSSEADMQPLRDALARADVRATAQALDKIHRKTVGDPTMLLLRAKGGPADLVFQWLQAALLLEKGAGVDQIASRLGSPSWAVERSIIPAAKRWKKKNLLPLMESLSRVDRGVFTGVPAPWVACTSALLKGCLSVSR